MVSQGILKGGRKRKGCVETLFLKQTNVSYRLFSLSCVALCATRYSLPPPKLTYIGSLDGLSKVKTATFKVVVIGDKGVGKTSTILNLCNIPDITGQYMPTHGMSEYSAYWPIKGSDGSVVVVRLRFCDAGVWCVTEQRAELTKELAKQQGQKADAVVYVCSSTDYASFKRVQNAISQNSEPVPLPKTRLVVMTRADQWVQRSVSAKELMSLYNEWSVRSLGISNITAREDAHTKADTVAILNALCKRLLAQAEASNNKS